MEGIFWKTLLVPAWILLSSPVHVAPSRLLQTPASNGRRSWGGFKVRPLLGHVFFQDTNSKGTQELNFTIKETVCPAKEEASLDKCDFKEGGVSDGYGDWASVTSEYRRKKRGEGEEEPGGGGGKKVVWCLGLLVMSSKPRREVEPLAK
uniref:Vipericidin n=1 Tax=Naja naja TaxID=35670 RepID=A0A8C6XU16_NAJNA